MNRTVELILARPADAEPIAVLARDLIETGLGWRWRAPGIRQQILAPESNVLTARSDSVLAGFGIMHYREEEAHLLLLAVHPRYRRHGLGGRLLAWLEKPARVAGIRRIHLEVRAGNTPARQFYQALGYREDRRVPNYYNGRETAVYMSRTLIS
ncbi:MAG: GNAT family N-acetyltransferase [Candidatus Competibacterales bacterium]|nr:GNAT family N-acetyltransferase [Candidatus Competibacterales bacterium]